MPGVGTNEIRERAPNLFGIALAASVRVDIGAPIIGDGIPVEGGCFPQICAPMIELQRAAVLDALVEGCDHAAEHTGADAEPTMGGEELQVNTSTGTELTWTLDQRATGAEIDERHGVPWAQDRVRPGDRRMPEAPIEAPLG